MCVYRKSDLESVDLASIVSTSKSNPRSKDRKTGLISVTVVAESLGIDQRSVYELVANGKLKAYTPQIADDDRNPKTYFTRHDVNDYKRRLMDGRDLVTTDEAARILNQSRSWFQKKWVMTGRLKVIKLPDDPMQRQYFVKTDVGNLIPFKGKTVNLGEASELLDVSRSILLSWEGTGKLRRVSGPKIDGAKSILYLRSDIEKLNRKGLRQ